MPGQSMHPAPTRRGGKSAPVQSPEVSVLVVDNYDSFVYTLVGYLEQLGARTTVIRNDEVTPARALELAAEHTAVLISPGPGAPADAGVSLDLIRSATDGGSPLFGVCLGHQAIAEAFGATVTHAESLMHGKTSLVRRGEHPMFEGVPSPFTATRYHSLAAVRPTVDEAVLEITAETEDGVVMGLAHRTAPLWGVQFHPESVLTEGGYRMLGNWLESVGLSGAAERGGRLSPLVRQD